MPLSNILRDKIARLLIPQQEQELLALKLITRDKSHPLTTRLKAQNKIQQYSRYAREVSITNRCIAHGKTRGVLGGFKMNHMVFREHALAGLIPGVKKAVCFLFKIMNSRILSKLQSSCILVNRIQAMPHPMLLFRHFSTSPYSMMIQQQIKPIDNEPSSAPLFTSLPLISKNTLQSLDRNFSFKTMTDVQEQVLSILPTDKDLLVRAKTGTGKTLAFVIAALESALARQNGSKFNGQSIPIVVISPTRELALQISKEAAKVLDAHRYRVESAVGGTSRNTNINAILRSRIDFLVATPGRLIDLLSNANVAEKFKKVECLILDEADQLLDMGFRDDIENIESYFPKTKQTFMFSATISPQIAAIAKSVLKSGYSIIDTVPENDVPTHMKVQQSVIEVPFSQQVYLLYDVIKKHQEQNADSKIIVFFSSTKIVSFLSAIFNSLPGMDIMQIHGKLTQGERQRISDRFRRSYSSVLFTTDVSARGVDYPGVTLVIQLGTPPSLDQYVHRIGRTGRAGKGGESILILSPYEKQFMHELKELPVKEEYRYSSKNTFNDEELTTLIKTSLKKRIYSDLAEECYSSYLNFYKQHRSLLKISNNTILASAKEYAIGVLGLDDAPNLSQSFLDKIGFKSSGNGERSYGNRGNSYNSDRSSFGSNGNGNPRGNYSGKGYSDRSSFGSSGNPRGNYSGGQSSGNYSDRSSFGSNGNGNSRGNYSSRDNNSFGGNSRSYGDRNRSN